MISVGTTYSTMCFIWLFLKVNKMFYSLFFLWSIYSFLLSQALTLTNSLQLNNVLHFWLDILLSHPSLFATKMNMIVIDLRVHHWHLFRFQLSSILLKSMFCMHFCTIYCLISQNLDYFLFSWLNVSFYSICFNLT